MPDDKGRWSNKRRSLRINWDASVVVHRPPKEGLQFYEKTQTLTVNAHGALIALTGQVAPRQRLLVQNAASGEQQECRVVYVERDLAGPTKVALEVTRPAPDDWRIAFPPDDWNLKEWGAYPRPQVNPFYLDLAHLEIHEPDGCHENQNRAACKQNGIPCFVTGLKSSSFSVHHGPIAHQSILAPHRNDRHTHGILAAVLH